MQLNYLLVLVVSICGVFAEPRRKYKEDGYVGQPRHQTREPKGYTHYQREPRDHSRYEKQYPRHENKEYHQPERKEYYKREPYHQREPKGYHQRQPKEYSQHEPKYGGKYYGGRGYDVDTITLEDGRVATVKAYGANANAQADGKSTGSRIIGTIEGSDGRTKTIVRGQDGELELRGERKFYTAAVQDGQIRQDFKYDDTAGSIRLSEKDGYARLDGKLYDNQIELFELEGNTQNYRISRGDVSLEKFADNSQNTAQKVNFRQKDGDVFVGS
eukprot:Platyproteum_vivax@DN7605_c1_g1_i22.p1